MSETFEVYVTKYALTVGIERYVAKEAASDGGIALVSPRGVYFWGEGRDWHRTLESAVARAEVMRKAKIASLRRSIAKIEGLTFGEPRP